MFGGHHEHGLRPGTENIAYIAGMAKAFELSVKEMREHDVHIKFLRDKLKNAIIEKIPNVAINASASSAISNILNVSFNYIEGESLLLKLDMAGIAVSTGSACASGSSEPSHVLSAMGVDAVAAQGAVRFSFGWRNTEEEVDYVLETLPKIVADLRKMSPVWNKKTN